MRLTDEELRRLSRPFSRDMLDADEVEGCADQVLSVIAELRSLRALLSTPHPCGHDEPRFVRQVGHGGIDGVEWNPLGTNGNAIVYEPDDGIAIAAALMRASLAAKGASE